MPEASAAKRRVLELVLDRPSLYGEDMSFEGSLLTELRKVQPDRRAGASGQNVMHGRKDHPFDRHLVKSLMTANVHHSTCIHTKVAAHVGVGNLSNEERAARTAMLQGDPEAAMLFRAAQGTQSPADESLDPLCHHTWYDAICDAAMDYHMTGDGYLEVVRIDPGQNGNGEITGIHHIPSEEVHMYIEEDGYNFHYEVEGGEEGSALRRFAAFGDLGAFLSRLPDMNAIGATQVPDSEQGNTVSEVIHFRKPTALSRWYGYPDWLAAVAPIELAQCLYQWKYDFFNNRGVPEFMLFILGQKLDEDDWEVIEQALQANIGKGNSHKSLALNLENENIKVQLEKLGLDNKGEDTFDKTSESLALAIVTAHRVPPLLAGIQVPGKLGATNELPNALVAFQALVIGQDQRVFQQTLGGTLGNSECNGQLGLTAEDFEYRRVLDQYDFGNGQNPQQAMDTMSRMRQTLPEAEAEGRDLDDGLRKAQTVELAKQALKIAEERGRSDLASAIQGFIDSKAA